MALKLIVINLLVLKLPISNLLVLKLPIMDLLVCSRLFEGYRSLFSPTQSEAINLAL